MNSSSQRIAEVERYIHELAIALSGLPADEREDVISGIREHIDDALLAIAEPTPPDVRRILDDLGDPLAIAADAGAPSDPRWPSDTPPARSAKQPVPLLRRDWIPAATVLAFAVGAVFAWVGGAGVRPLAVTVWLAGLVALIASPLWSRVEKAIGTAVFGVGPLLAAASGVILGAMWWRPSDLPLIHRHGFVDNWWFAGPSARTFLAAIALVVAVATGVWLLRRGSNRARE